MKDIFFSNVCYFCDFSTRFPSMTVRAIKSFLLRILTILGTWACCKSSRILIVFFLVNGAFHIFMYLVSFHISTFQTCMEVGFRFTFCSICTWFSVIVTFDKRFVHEISYRSCEIFWRFMRHAEVDSVGPDEIALRAFILIAGLFVNKSFDRLTILASKHHLMPFTIIKFLITDLEITFIIMVTYIIPYFDMHYPFFKIKQSIIPTSVMLCINWENLSIFLSCFKLNRNFEILIRESSAWVFGNFQFIRMHVSIPICEFIYPIRFLNVLIIIFNL